MCFIYVLENCRHCNQLLFVCSVRVKHNNQLWFV